MDTEKVLGWEQLANKALDNASNVFEAVSKSITGAINEYGATAVDAVLWVIRVDNIQKLVFGFLLLIILSIYWFIFGRKLNRHINQVGRVTNIDFSMGFVTVISGVITIVLVTTVLVRTVLDAWVWVGVFKPELWIAKQVVVKIENIANKK